MNDENNVVNWGKLRMFCKPTCLCLIHSVYTKCENVHIFAKMKPQSIITTALLYWVKKYLIVAAA